MPLVIVHITIADVQYILVKFIIILLKEIYFCLTFLFKLKM